MTLERQPLDLLFVGKFRQALQLQLFWFRLVILRVLSFASSRKYSLALPPPLCKALNGF